MPAAIEAETVHDSVADLTDTKPEELTVQPLPVALYVTVPSVKLWVGLAERDSCCEDP